MKTKLYLFEEEKWEIVIRLKKRVNILFGLIKVIKETSFTWANTVNK